MTKRRKDSNKLFGLSKLFRAGRRAVFSSAKRKATSGTRRYIAQQTRSLQRYAAEKERKTEEEIERDEKCHEEIDRLRWVGAPYPELLNPSACRNGKRGHIHMAYRVAMTIIGAVCKAMEEDKSLEPAHIRSLAGTILNGRFTKTHKFRKEAKQMFSSFMDIYVQRYREGDLGRLQKLCKEEKALIEKMSFGEDRSECTGYYRRIGQIVEESGKTIEEQVELLTELYESFDEDECKEVHKEIESRVKELMKKKRREDFLKKYKKFVPTRAKSPPRQSLPFARAPTAPVARQDHAVPVAQPTVPVAPTSSPSQGAVWATPVYTSPYVAVSSPSTLPRPSAPPAPAATSPVLGKYGAVPPPQP